VFSPQGEVSDENPATAAKKIAAGTAQSPPTSMDVLSTMIAPTSRQRRCAYLILAALLNIG
jgi:hypothetical protein